MRGIDADSDWTALLPGFLIAGAGIGMVNPALATAAVGVVPPQRAGMASGINSTFRQVGIATGIAGLGAVFQGLLTNKIPGIPGEVLATATPTWRAGSRGTLPGGLQRRAIDAVRDRSGHRARGRRAVAGAHAPERLHRPRSTGGRTRRMRQPLVEHRLELAGFDTRALELEGDGPPLVLLHGFADSADTWRLVLDRLAPDGRQPVEHQPPRVRAVGEPVQQHQRRTVAFELERPRVEPRELEAVLDHRPQPAAAASGAPATTKSLCRVSANESTPDTNAITAAITNSVDSESV